MLKYKKRWLLSLCLLLLPLTATANDVAWKALKNGEAVALMRHAIAPDTNEASLLEPEKCADERNLSAEGRDQAIKIGEMFRNNGIAAASVYTSSFCRCMDTGKLLDFDEVKNLSAINSFYADRSKGHAQIKALTTWIKKAIADKSGPNILVSHGLNVSGLMSTFAQQGDVLIIGVENGELVTLLQFGTSVP